MRILGCEPYDSNPRMHPRVIGIGMQFLGSLTTQRHPSLGQTNDAQAQGPPPSDSATVIGWKCVASTLYMHPYNTETCLASFGARYCTRSLPVWSSPTSEVLSGMPRRALDYLPPRLELSILRDAFEIGFHVWCCQAPDMLPK